MIIGFLNPKIDPVIGQSQLRKRTVMNTSQARRQARSEAIAEVLTRLREIRCPPGKPPGWATEFSQAVAAATRVLENQLAQAEGCVRPRKGKF